MAQAIALVNGGDPAAAKGILGEQGSVEWESGMEELKKTHHSHSFRSIFLHCLILHSYILLLATGCTIL